MRLIAAFFLVAVFPVIVFLSAVLYGGITPSTIKKSLTSSSIYSTIPQMLSSGGNEDGMNAFFSGFSETYLREKSEKLIDDTDLWVRGKTEEAPVLSFADLKKQFIDNNPEIFAMIEQQMDQMNESGNTDESMAQMKEFMKSDFTFPIAKQLSGVRDAYRFMSILFPVLCVLAALAVVVILYFSKSWKSRLKQLGVVCVIAAFYGFLWVVGSSIVFAILKGAIEINGNGFAQIILPIVISIAQELVDTYQTLQTNTSILLIVAGVVMFASTYLLGNHVNVKVSRSKSSKK